jgi:hypothetical protein
MEKKNLFETGTEPEQIVSNEITGQTVTQESQEQISQEENFDNWDKQKAVEAYKNLQRKITEQDLTVKQLAEDKIRAEERAKILEQFAAKPTPKPQVDEDPEPIVPNQPNKPQDYNLADALGYPESESGKYLKAKEVYEEKVNQKLQWQNRQLSNTVNTIKQSLEEDINTRMKNEDFARRKANKIAWLARGTNGDLKKAGEVFETIQEIMNPDKEKPEYFITLHDIIKNNPKTILKDKQAVLRNERQQFTPPGATVQGEGENAKQEKTFVQSIGSRRRNNHSLFETEKK